MKIYVRIRRAPRPTRLVVAAVALVLLLAQGAWAISYDLTAGAFTKTLPGGQIVTMWGYKLTGTADPFTSPGPELTVPTGETTLTVNLTNALPAGPAHSPTLHDTSIVIPGLIATGQAPVYQTIGAIPKNRMTSFDRVATPGGGAVTYTFQNVRPGSYLYMSGSNPALQVEMGLYGPAKRLAAPGQAYAGVAFDTEATLILGEIDPAMHAAVAGGTYGTPVYPSAFDHHPKFFLVNGEPFTSTRAPVFVGAANQTVLLRILNAGLQIHVPATTGAYMTVVGEDAYEKDHPRRQLALMLAPQKRLDVTMTVPDGKTLIYDRTLDVVNANIAGPGGMMVFLQSGAAPIPTCRGDLNQNGQVDASDLQIFLDSPEFGRSNCTVSAPCATDYNGDGRVNMRDLRLINSWVGTCPAPAAAVVEPAASSGAPALSRGGKPPLNGDFDGNGSVDHKDLRLMLDAVDDPACAAGDCAADLNGDGKIDTADLALFKAAMLASGKKGKK